MQHYAFRRRDLESKAKVFSGQLPVQGPFLCAIIRHIIHTLINLLSIPV